jgi:pyridoxal phosphate enzyme (YggS family)
VKVLAVSKTVPPDRLRAAVAAGITEFGENRVQEAEAKRAGVPGAHWTLIGHLQSNKAARAIALVDEIQSVDSVALAERIARLARDAGHTRYPIYLQVNVDRDPAKAGFLPDALPEAASIVANLPGLEIRGLMTVGRQVATAQEARPTFRALRQLSERLRRATPDIGGGLSMGMSDDFEVALEEGATVVRLGRVLFGERPA